VRELCEVGAAVIIEDDELAEALGPIGTVLEQLPAQFGAEALSAKRLHVGGDAGVTLGT
jgi:hypothetical protein